MRGVRAVVVVWALTAWTASAHAETSAADRALAQSLFEDGRKMMQAGSLREACATLEKSEALDPSGGTLLNLALCHEKQGKTATAWAEFHDALVMARKDRRDEREDFAQKHIAELDTKLSRLTLKIANDALPERVEVLRNGVPVKRAGWNAAAPVDPGSHEIVARAPGYETWTVTVVVGDHADAKTVEIPALHGRPSGPTPASSADVQRPVGFALLALGVVAVGVGAGFGVHALARDGTAHGACGSDTTCPRTATAGISASQDAVTSARVTDALLFGGLAVAGAGLAIALTARPPADASTPLARVVIGPRRLGFALAF